MFTFLLVYAKKCSAVDSGDFTLIQRIDSLSFSLLCHFYLDNSLYKQPIVPNDPTKEKLSVSVSNNGIIMQLPCQTGSNRCPESQANELHFMATS